LDFLHNWSAGQPLDFIGTVGDDLLLELGSFSCGLWEWDDTPETGGQRVSLAFLNQLDNMEIPARGAHNVEAAVALISAATVEFCPWVLGQT
jgi:hypothetical protein